MSSTRLLESSVPEPTLVFYKSTVCRHCQNLTNIWNDVTVAIKKSYPKLRFSIVTANDNSGKFDENSIPKDLIRYAKWFPMILLIPGRLWDYAMANLGPKNNVEIKDGVQVMNAIIDKNTDKMSYVQKYDIRKPDDFVNWLREAFDNEDFKRVQNGTIGNDILNNVIVPTIPTLQQPIQPIISNIIRPTNSNSSYTSAGSDRHAVMEPISNICSMRIISRPK